VQWSGLDAITTWTVGVNSSDYQDLPDGGIVRGIAGGEYGVIFQESTIRRMVFVGGSLVFQIDRAAEDKGLTAPYSLIRAGERIFFLAAQGFHMILPGTGGAIPIGKERVDRTFFADFDTGEQFIIGCADPRAPRVYWGYKSGAGVSGQFDKILCFDYALDRWSLAIVSGEYLCTLAQPGMTLEGLDSISGSIDALPYSLDSVTTASLSQLSGISTSHVLGFFSGTPLEATLDTAEQGDDTGRRVRVKGFRPITDAGTCYGSLGRRETVQSSVSYSTEQAVNAIGNCPANVSTRLARGRLRIPAGTSWTFASGIEPFFAQEGRR
jgi:hypothetical protein